MTQFQQNVTCNFVHAASHSHSIFPSGILNVVVTTPLWVVNTRLKLQGAKFRAQNCENNKKYQGLLGEYTCFIVES